jgi:hypothetical protein
MLTVTFTVLRFKVYRMTTRYAFLVGILEKLYFGYLIIDGRIIDSTFTPCFF